MAHHVAAGDSRGPVISVMLAVPDAPAAVSWYTRALGAELLWSLGPVAGLDVGGAPFFVGQPEGNGWESPTALGTTSARIEVFCDDPDAFVARAIAEGATGGFDPVRDHQMPWSIHRQGGFLDPFGHLWLVGDRSPLERMPGRPAAAEPPVWRGAMEPEDLRRLMTHMEWAEAQTWAAARGVEPAARDPRLLDLAYHLHTVQVVYGAVWRGREPVPPDRLDFDSVAAVAARARIIHADLREFAAGVTRDQLTTELEMPWRAEIAKRYGIARPATLGDTICQVVLHSTYHRGQIATRVREVGGEPHVTDFILWVWTGCPEPAW